MRVKKSAYMKGVDLSKADVTAYQEVGIGVVPKETISMVAQDDLMRFLSKAINEARSLRVQRQASSDRTKGHLANLMSTPPKMNFITVELAVIPQAKGFLVLSMDGAHRTEAVIQAMELGRKDIRVNINICVVKDIDSAREWSTTFDTRSQMRTAKDQIDTTFGEEADGKGGHIRLLNSALVNIREGCPNGDMSRIEECDPKFPRITILKYEHLRTLRDQYGDVLEWFHLHFPISSQNLEGRLLSVGVTTGIILSYLVARKRKESLVDLLEVWRRYINGEFTVNNEVVEGYQGLRDLHRNILGVRSIGGTQRIQFDHFQRAVFGYNMVRNNASLNGRSYRPGSHYRLGVGVIKTKDDAAKKVVAKAVKKVVKKAA
jgi:hypothetical protein